MFKPTNVISRRIQRMKKAAVGCAVLFLLLLEAGILCGALTEPKLAQLYVLLGAVLAAALGAIWHFYIERASQQQAERDEAFVNSSGLDETYEALYIWSDSCQAVLQQYQALTDRKERMQMSIESSRYLALQQQINPHFLYNTLDAIRSDMLIAGEVRIADTVEALSKYFSYVVSNMDRLASIDEELNNVRDYFRVQEYRFEDRIAMEIVDEIGQQNIEDLMIPRLTLQPLVENAISHGLEKSLRHGTVTIRLTATRKTLEIHVSDDGEGMSPETLERLNQMLRAVQTVSEEEPSQGQRKRRGGIALRNVNRRIKLLFGEEYGLKAYSMQGAGTELCVCLPKVAKEDLNEDGVFTGHGRRQD